jgi:hypothetical protein
VETASFSLPSYWITRTGEYIVKNIGDTMSGKGHQQDLYRISIFNLLTDPLFQVAAPARAGAIAPCDVIVEAQNTGMGPEKTSFFQALNISTKIAKGAIEIVVSILK